MSSRALGHGLTWTGAASVAGLLLQLLQLGVLARYLQSAEFGVFAIAMVVVGLAQAFADLGVTSAIFHRRDITREQLAALYWVNLAAGAAVFVGLVVLAPVVAALYGAPELTRIQAALAACFLLMPVGQQFQVLLQRDFHFELIAKIEIAARIVGVSIACLLAVQGAGTWALVGGVLANAFVAAGCYLIVGVRRYKPRFAARWAEAKGFLAFGLYQMGDRLLGYFNAEFDTLLIGRLLGTEALGGYSLAKQLAFRPTAMLNPVVTRVLLPHLSAHPHDEPRRRKVYLDGMNLMASANFPICVVLFAFAEPITAVLFGERWGHVAPIIQALAVWGLIRSTGNPLGVLLLSRGRVDLAFKWNLALFAFIPATIYVGSHWGALGVAYALAALQIVLAIPSWRFLVLPMCGAGFVEYHGVLLRVFALTLAAVGLAVLASTAVAGAFAELLVGGAVVAATYAVLVRQFNRPVLAALHEAR